MQCALDVTVISLKPEVYVHPKLSQRIVFETTCRRSYTINEPAHEIMILFVLRELILQTCVGSHPVGLDV